MPEIEIKDESSNHIYRTELPNIIFEIGLPPQLIGVYATIKRAAGDNGYCSKSEKHLAEPLSITSKTLRSHISQLEEINPFLKKPLLKIKKRVSEHGDRDTTLITIVDIWPDNYKFFTKGEGGQVNFTGPSVNFTEGVRSKLPDGPVKFTDKQEQSKKNCIKNQQQEENVVVVFSCLEVLQDPSISQKHKTQITKAYQSNEQLVRDAVAVVTHESFIPDENLLKSLRAALKHEWKPKQGSEMDFENNKILAKKLEGQRNNYTFSALNKHLEIIKGPSCECVEYAMSFKKFYSEVEKKGKINIKQEIGA